MTVETPTPVSRVRSDRVQRLATHMREPLYRNSYALVATTFSTSFLGFLYWAFAARAYDQDTVGRNAVLITTMMFLTNLASLNFTDVLNRFVPVSGPRARKLVNVSYLIAVSLGGLAAVVFILGRNYWTPALDVLLRSPRISVLFIAAVMVWVIFVLQDAVLVGLRRATYVLAENTAFGVAKIVLLVAFAAAFPTTGIFLSWTVPLAAVVVVVNWILFRRFIPHYVREHRGVTEPINLRHVSGFLGADYVASVASTAATSLMPLIVLSTNGSKAAGYVVITWTVAYSLYLVTRNIGMALTTEGSTDPDNLARYTRAAITAAARIVVPLSLTIVIGAPWFLEVFGGNYAADAVGLMRLFALSAIPAIVPLTVASVARVQRRLKTLVAVSCASSLPVLVLLPFCLHVFGLAGAGLAWVVVQSVVALVLVVHEFGHAWGHPETQPTNGSWVMTAKSAPVPTFETVEFVPEPRKQEAPLNGVEELSSVQAETHGSRGATQERLDCASEASVQAPLGARAQRAGVKTFWPVVTLGGSVLLWALTLAQLNTTSLGKYGLVSNLPVVYFFAIALVSGGFVLGIHRRASIWVLAAHGVLLLLMLHATPAITYAELRYSWAWKHVGIVDMMQHQHALRGGTAVLDIYRHWPGFFAAATALVDATGVRSALSFAQWGPPFFAILDAALLAVALRSLTNDTRRIALAVWLFVIANWVGQEYFAPQSYGFALYLAIMVIVLHWYQRPTATIERLRSKSKLPARVEVARRRDTAPQRRTVAIVLLALMLATTTSHPLTPVVVCISLGALLVFRVLDRRWPLVAMVTFMLVWLVTGAWGYTSSNLPSFLEQIGRLGSNVDSNLAVFGNLSPAQHTVANMGRMVVAVMAVLAVAGFVRRLRHGHLDRAAVALCVGPAMLLVAGAYGGEAIFRAYLFALPFCAYLAAGLFFPARDVHGSRRTTIAVAAVTCVLLIGFQFAYFGKDAWSNFTPSEARAAAIVYDTAPRNSVLITGTLAYPTQFRNVDRFTYVTLGAEPHESVEKVLQDPVGVLRSWMTDPRFAKGYVILTKAQLAEVDATGVLPRGSLQQVEQQLLGAPGIKVLYHDPDALLVTVDRPDAPEAASTASGGER